MSSRIRPAFLLVLLATCWVTLLLVLTIAGRIAYPFDLEWMEGGMLLHVARLRDGAAIYVPPSADFTPFLYPPLYPQLLSWIAGPSLLVGRIVSVAGIAASAAALLVALRRCAVPWILVLGALGAFLSTYDDTGGFFDVTRCDGMALGLVTWAIVLGVGGGRRRALGAALLLFLACATKQSMGVLAIPIAWTLARRQGWKDAAFFAVPAGVLLAAYAGWMTWSTDGWFWVYVVRIPGLHGLDPSRLFPDPERRLLVALPVMAIAAIAMVRKSAERAPGLTLGPSLATLVLLAILMRAHRGGYYNVLLPGFWALSAAGALGAARLLEWMPGPMVRASVAALLSLQCVAGGWRPSKYVPSEDDRRAGESVVEALRSRPGTLFAPEFPTFARAAGRWPGTHIYALADLERPGSPWLYAIQAVKADLAAGRWDRVLTSDRPTGVLTALQGRYRPEVRFPLEGRTLMPRSGFPVRPAILWARSEGGAETSGSSGTVP